MTAAAEGKIDSVRMITHKPVRGLAGAPYLLENNIDIEEITEPLRIFSGTPREAAIGFPANLNVAVALSLAGIGADRTTLEIGPTPRSNATSPGRGFSSPRFPAGCPFERGVGPDLQLGAVGADAGKRKCHRHVEN